MADEVNTMMEVDLKKMILGMAEGQMKASNITYKSSWAGMAEVDGRGLIYKISEDTSA
jgi:hypothetical protein